MTTIEQIKAEIERQIKDPQEHCYGVSSINKLRELLDFIDTLESEKQINPDDAMKELDEKIALVKERGTWKDVDVDSYMDEVRGRVSDDLEETAEKWVFENCFDCDIVGEHRANDAFNNAEEITPIMAEYVADVFSRKEHLDNISYGYCMEIADVFRRYAERAKQEQQKED